MADDSYTQFYAIECPDCRAFIGTSPVGDPPPRRCGSCQQFQDRLQPIHDKLDRVLALLEQLMAPTRA
jgi:uracil-DNA glycosylase